MHFELNDSQAVLNQKVNTLVTGLKEIDQLKRSGLFWNYFGYNRFEYSYLYGTVIFTKFFSKLLKVGGIVIPVEVFNYIDQGQNPSLYTKNTLERALAKNEQVKGKIEVYSQFRQGRC